jgi:hypothetical protein
VIQKDVLVIASLIVVAIGLLAHAFFPRYDYRTVQNDKSISIIVYDRWAGRFQRAVYGDNGDLKVMGVYSPF